MSGPASRRQFMRRRKTFGQNAGRLNSLIGFLLGAAAAGTVFASAEVFWNIVYPLLPFEVLRAQHLLPPRNFGAFAAVALVTYVTIALLAALFVYLFLRAWLRQRSTVSLFALGAFVIGIGLSSCFVVVWINLLSKASSPATILVLLYASALALVILMVGLPCWLFSLTRSLRLLTCAPAVLVPVILFLGVAQFLHGYLIYQPRANVGIARRELPNIILVTIDTLRADHLGAYGGLAKTPTLDELANTGVRFDLAVSQVPTTTPSLVSIFTSVYPFEHGAKNGVPMRADLPTLPQMLAPLGYHTAAFTSAYTARSNITGLGDSFNLYMDSLSAVLPMLSNDAVEPLFVYRLLERATGNQISAAVVNTRVKTWLDSAPPEPFFVWIHYFDPHAPYDPPPAYRAVYAPKDGSRSIQEMSLYDAEITYTDAELAEILEQFKIRDYLDNALVVVTSDHGEAFGEPHPHVDYGHGRHLYDSVLHVPLIFWCPGCIKGGRVVTEQVECIDIAPTLIDLLGARPPESFRGRSLAGYLRGGEKRSAALAFSQTAKLIRPRWFAVRSPGWKLIVNPDNGEKQLFHLQEDPEERVNLIASNPEEAAYLHQRLKETMQLDVEGGNIHDIDEETIERLRSLGYIQ